MSFDGSSRKDRRELVSHRLHRLTYEICVICGLFVFAINVSSQSPGPFRRHLAPSVTFAVSADGFLVAVARSSGGRAKRFGRVELWDARTGELQRTITGFDGPIWSLTFSKDGRSVITVSTEYRDAKIQAPVKERNEKTFAELKWWDVQTGEFIKKAPLAKESITSVAATWSPRGDLFALAERYVKNPITRVALPGIANEQRPRPFEMVEETDLKLLDAQTGERQVKVEDVDKTFSGGFWEFWRAATPCLFT